MKKNIFPFCFILCSNYVFGEQIKKLTDKEFVVKKQRNESFQDIQKPKYFANNSDEQKFIPQKFSLQDIELDIKTLPINLDLHEKEKKIQRVKHNLVRLGMGMGFQTDDKFFSHVADVLLKKKFNNFSTHLILKSRNSSYPGWLGDLQFFADYKATNSCKPFFIFDQSWKSFQVSNGEAEKKKNTGLDFIFNLGCPLVLEKSEFYPSLDFRFSKFNSLENIAGEKEDKGSESEVNLNFDFSLDLVDKFKFSCDTFVKNLNYDKGFLIGDLQDGTLKELGDDNNVTLFKAQPKLHFLVDKIDLAPKLCLDYCSNKRFVKDSAFSFCLGIRAEYEVNSFVNVYFDIDNGLKTNTFKDLFAKNPWICQQAVMASKDNLGLSLGADAKISNFKFNFEIEVNDYVNYPNFSNIKPEEEKFPKYSIEYIGVTRFKEMLGVSFDLDSFSALLSGALYQYNLQNEKKILYQPSFDLKSDVFFNIVDKILLHLNLRTLSGIKSSRKNAENVNETFPMGINIGAGVDYVFSDLFTFFVNFENLLKNSLITYDDCPSGLFKIIFGATVTPDKWIEKDLQNELV